MVCVSGGSFFCCLLFCFVVLFSFFFLNGIFPASDLW